MAAAVVVDSPFPEELKKGIEDAKILVVGAGGIGCELLKNLVLVGFKEIDLIDLDTIDVSNLNRQFLFQRCHVGMSKALAAKESVLRFNPDVTINAHHDNITGNKFGLNYFKKFSLVLNALDNIAARSHVNRMCLAAEVPLVESGTAGYTGQVEVILKGKTECYECQPRQAARTFPGCTIRNTPSEPIHCIVWAKHLFNQLFGEEDPDEDVSPDTADPEAVGDAGDSALAATAKTDGNVERTSTRTWAKSHGYDPEKLFHKLFHDDIKYLLSMERLWERRRPPTPLQWGKLPDAVAGGSGDAPSGLKDQRVWSMAECARVFAESIAKLSQRVSDSKDTLVWDKDDEESLDFVAACANIRAAAFSIAQNNRFDIKAMAGNIIPAIATTNAIVAAVVVLRAFKLIQKLYEDCKTVYLQSTPNPRGLVLVPEKHLIPAHKSCHVCADQPQVQLYIDVEHTTIAELEELVLKKSLNMVAPDVVHEGTQSILISSEEGELDNGTTLLKDAGIVDGTLLKCDDFLQNYELALHVFHKEAKKDEPSFKIVANSDQLKPREEEQEKPKNGSSESHATSSVTEVTDLEDDVVMVEIEEPTPPPSLKRRASPIPAPSKKVKVMVAEDDDECEVITL